MNTPEDETFRKLKQSPYEEVAASIAANNERDYKAVDDEIILQHYGWTMKEYQNEWDNRYKDGR